MKSEANIVEQNPEDKMEDAQKVELFFKAFEDNDEVKMEF